MLCAVAHTSRCLTQGSCRCFETQADKYTYSMCVFGEAVQKEGAAQTRLGSWKGFADNYLTMRFEGGQGCWQGPARSLQVLSALLPLLRLAACILHEQCSAESSSPMRPEGRSSCS